MRVLIIAVAVLAWIALAFVLGFLLKLHGADFWILSAGLSIIGIIAGVAVWWFTRKREGDVAEPMDEKDEVEALFREAEARLAKSRLGSGARLSTLPVFFIMGERGATKTTTVLHSGLEPEPLAGQVYQDNNVIPTTAANLWFARDAVLFEPAAALLEDGKRWTSIVRRLRPGRLMSVSKSAQAPRAALVCFDIETFLKPGGADAAVASARRMHARLNEISQNLGIRFPVYVLFTRADRVPFFLDFTANFTSEEAAQVFGATLPAPPRDSKRIFSEEQSSRIIEAFNELYHGLAAKRPDILIREHDEGKLPGAYEFPREFRKIRDLLTRFLVELSRPNQLAAGPFLRGFYFTGVRPVTVADAAPATVRPQPERPRFEPAPGATRMFSPGAMAEVAPAVAQPAMGTRRVPEWVFLNRLFTEVLLADRQALAASGASTQTSTLRRALLAAACAACLFFAAAWTVSFFGNNALEGQVLAAAQGIGADQGAGGELPSADALARLDRLRESVARLADYQRNGAPLGLGWGLYTGNRMFPAARRLYFNKFNQLLFANTRKNLLSILSGLPASPGPNDDYTYAYDTLKTYLITTSNHERSTKEYLAPVLMNRWLAGRTLDPARADLARRQFDFYATELAFENPFGSDNDASAVEHAREYLAKFGGADRVYAAMIADAGKSNLPINFNARIAGSAAYVIDSYDVKGAFTKGGWKAMQDNLKHVDRFFKGEEWVLGPQAASAIDLAKLSIELGNRYQNDFLTEWRNYMKAARVVEYRTIPDAAQKLKALAGPQSPLLALFWLASQNTGVDNADVKKAFTAVQAVVPPTATDSYIGPGNKQYMDALLQLQISLEQLAQQSGAPNDAAANATQTAASNAKLAAGQMAQGFGVDSVAHLEATSERLLEDPITYVVGLLRGLGPSELNKKGAGLCSQLSTALGKFPFNPASQTQATIADVNGVFKPKDGALWAFYNDNLSKYLIRQGTQYVPDPSAPVKLNDRFVQFFNRAAAFSDAAYEGGSADPHFSYTVKPAFQADVIKSVTLTLDGQTAEMTAGFGAKSFNWQAAGPHGVNVMVHYASGDTVPFGSYNGLWAVFEWTTLADVVQGPTHEWRFKIGRDDRQALPPVRFDIGSPILQKGHFAGMGCVSNIAKP